MVLNQNQMDEWERIFEQEELFSQLLSLMDDYYDFTYAKIGKDVPKRLVNQLRFVASQYLCKFRMMGLRHALEHNRIVIPEDIKKSTIAMYMILK
jgi:hypothetical protein